ncbi:MAG: response regulator transcription factor [Candidatus Promineifilaceae bacterium]
MLTMLYYLEQQPHFKVAGKMLDTEAALSKPVSIWPDMIFLELTAKNVIQLAGLDKILATWPGVKVLIVSTLTDTAVFRQAIYSGASGYFRVGEPLPELQRAIRAVCNGNVYLSPTLAHVLVEDFISRQLVNPHEPTALDILTPREKEILILLAHGFNNREIADQLFISINTVKTHRLNVYKKLDINDRSDLVTYALHHGLI